MEKEAPRRRAIEEAKVRPEHYFFVFTLLTPDGREIGEGTAVVAGHQANCNGLTFSLESGDARLQVALDAGTPLAPEMVWMREWAGVYTHR